MASQLSQMDALNIYFLKSSKPESTHYYSVEMLKAYFTCQNNGMNPRVILDSECCKLNLGKTDIFVLEKFEGEFFKKLEITKCCRVVGPQCLLRCFFTGEPVPPCTNPVFTTAMKDFVVYASGFNSKIKDRIRKKVGYMGGIYIEKIQPCITHLVVHSVLTAKYEKVTENKTPIHIFTLKWIKAVWNANLTGFIPANDPSFDKYKCPTFMNLLATTSNLSKHQKKEVKKLLKENGGRYVRNFKPNVRVLVASDNSLSEKFKFALRNNIACLKFEWVIESVNAGYALPMHNYLITLAPRALCSTPENGSTQIIHSSLNFSAISNIPNDNNRNFIEEPMSNTIAINRDNIIDRNISPCVSIVERLDKPQTVMPDADNDDDDDDDDEPNIVQQSIQKSNVLINRVANIHNQSNSCVSTDKNLCLPGSSSIEQRQRQTMKNKPANGSEVPSSQSSIMSAQFFTGLTFLVWGFDDEENALAIRNIEGLGGSKVTNSYSGVPDYGVVPITGVGLLHTVSEIVTYLYIEDCINNEKIIDIAYYHRPLAVPASAKPLADCVIAISSYSGFERIYLKQLAVALGARQQDLFARLTNIEIGQYAGTHLICPSPVGKKYVAAVKWNLPAVTAEWLLACAEKLQLIDETPYLVGETVAPIRENNLNSSIMAPLINTPTRQILTPERTLTQTPGLDTPIINERLSLSQNSTINSPGHISTPDSPYGQVFKPNPSPATRKMWVEMMYPEHIANKILPNRTWFQIVNPHYRGEYRQDRPTMDDHDELSVNKDDEMETPINRVLAFTEDEESRSKKNALDEQLEQRDKILRATSTSKTPCSLLRKKEKAYEEPRDHIMPATQPESVCWEDLKRIAKDAQEKLPLDIVEEISTKIDPSRRRSM
ncbi:hypothetical protein PV328_008830 [Microctonus aethiopoides]|uniref:BRCT domain-containing protein n=1 Tax=Microctonus aethiopoides TaxID=144406 RepID=A0AA39FKE3_9HYME|nr:hypothetical protein PV328_008830 [Microctonus aethiopoides]